MKSDWVTGNSTRLVKVLLHGLMGPITLNGKTFESPMVMPGFAENASFSDQDLADIATYIRNDWGNSARAIKPVLVQKVRSTTSNQTLPFTEQAL